MHEPMANALTRDSEGTSLSLEWGDRGQSVFHAVWLRDNCRCERCGIPETGRRQARLTAIDLSISVLDATINGDKLAIKWSDGIEGAFYINWLRQNAYDSESRKNRSYVPTLWTDTTRDSPPLLEYSSVNQNDQAFLEMLEAVWEFGLCFLRGAPPVPDTLSTLAVKIGPIQESNFGQVQDLVVDFSKQSVANRTVALKPHTDEPYRASPPGLLMFHCIETDATGSGSSIFMDGFELAEALRNEDPDGFNALATLRQPFRRYFADDVDLLTEFPILSVDEFGNLMGIRLNDRVGSPLSLPYDQMETYYRALKRLLDLAEDKNRMLSLTLTPGDIAIFDNHRILHGRTELTMAGRRWLQWLQVERGDFYSRLRILAKRSGPITPSRLWLRGAYG
jgi:gamma-butyrobetaine dioxygenase